MSLSNARGGWKLALVAATLGSLAAGNALADGGKRKGWDRHYDDRHSDYDYARVVDVDPIVRRVRVTEPVRECYEETRYERDDRYDRPAARGAAGNMILGGIIGAAVGNQIGSGDGRRAATVAGAIIGSAIGHDAAARRDARDDRRYGDRYDDRYGGRPYTVERCDIREVESWEERIEAYRVTYDYQGRRGSMTLPYDPGPKVRVRVDVRPAEY